MKKTLLPLAILIGAAMPATSAIITIDFDNVAAGPILSTALVPYGIDSVTSSAGSIPASVNRCGGGCSNTLPGSSHSYFATAGGTFPAPTGIFSTTLLFHDPTPYFSFYKSGYSVSTVGVAGWRADAYDASNNVVQSVGVNLAGGLDYPPSPTPVQYTLQGGANISKVIFLVNYNFQSTTGNLQTDFFQFQTAPEPTTLMLAACTLAFGLAYRRFAARRG